MESMADVVAKHKADIFSVLKDNIAETPEDERILENLKKALHDKKDEFEKDLWKSSNKIDLSKNDDLIKFWEDKVNGVYSWALATSAENDEVKDLIKNSLDKIQHLDEQNKSWTLFGGKTFDISDTKKNTKLPEIVSILEATDTSALNTNIDNFIKWVRKTKNPFHIQHSKLYTQPVDTQRDVSIRIALYLYCMNTIIEESKMTKDLYTKFKDVLENQVISLEIPKIKWIYNVKKELENVEPEYDMLKDINIKAWDIDLWTEKYWAVGIKKTQNLTIEFENWLATDIENYKIDVTKLITNPAYNVKLKNLSWDVLDFNVSKNDFSEVDLFIDVGGKDIKLGKIWINNKHGWSLSANLDIELDDLSSIQSQLTPAEISTVFPIELNIPVQWIKDVKNSARWKVALTKDIKIKLDVDWWWPVPPPPPPPWPIGTLDDELDVNFSDMKQSMKDIADERTYNEDSREYIEALKNKNTKFGKMLVAAKQAMLWDFFRMRKYKKELKDMDGKKTWLNVRWDWANVAKVHGWQWLNTVMELTQTNHPIVYTSISNLALKYYSGWSVMTDMEFERELKQIFASRDAEALVSELESNGVSIDKSASDILQSLQIQKAQNTLTYQVSQAVSSALWTRTSLSVAEADTLANNISTLFNNFTQTNKLVPQLFSHYNKLVPTADQINLNDTYENISKKMVAHIDSLTLISAQSMTNRVKLNIKFLADWHSVDHIEAKKWEKQSRWNPAAKLWNIMYGKWYKWRRFPTKVLATWWTAALWTLLLWPLWWIVAWSIVAWSLAAGKKAAQTKRKKHSIEKEYIKDRDNKTNIMNQEDLMKLKYLDDIWNYNEIKKDVERILSQPVISKTDQDNLIWLLSRMIAWLDYQKESGHNAFSLQKKVSTSRPEADEITREKNYNEAMSELYKLKELSLKRLQLQDVNLTEDDIRNEAQYDSYLSGYKWDFKKFLKLFKKERTKEMRKTWWRTAAIYGAVWWVTLWLAHFLDWVWWDADIDIDTSEIADTWDAADVTAPEANLPIESIEDLGDASTLYDLWKFESSSDFSKDIADQLSKMSSDSGTIKVDYFAWVDWTPANASSFTIDMIEDKASEIEDILNSGNFSQETIDNVKQVISDDNIKELIKFAESNGADAWNKNLFALRNLEGIEELLKQVDGKSDINLEFNFSDSNSTIWNTSNVAQDRMTWIDLEAVVEKTPDTPIDPDVPVNPDPGTKSGTSWRWWQWVYTEDNTHKWQDNI